MVEIRVCSVKMSEERVWELTLQCLWLGSVLSVRFWKNQPEKPPLSLHFHEFHMHWQLTSSLGTASQEGKDIGLFSAPSAFRGFWDFGFQTSALPC